MTAPMIEIQVQDIDGRIHRVAGKPGQSVMRAVVDAGLQGIAADCGGCLTCATCHVFVAPEWTTRLPPPGPDERAMLEMTATPAEPSSRLSCQLVLGPELAGLSLRLPPTQY